MLQKEKKSQKRFVIIISKSDSGVNSVNISAVDSPTESTDASTPHTLTSVIMDLRITNRVYNDSLADQQSAEYSTLKQEVEQLVRVSC